MNKCAYCTNPEVKARTIINNELAFAFPTYIPITPGHVLICPIRCVSTINELSKECINVSKEEVAPSLNVHEQLVDPLL